MAADRNKITIWILIEKFEIFGKILTEGFDRLLEQDVILGGLFKLLSFIIENDFELLGIHV